MCFSGLARTLVYFSVKFCLVVFQDTLRICSVSVKLWSFVWSCFRTHSESALFQWSCEVLFGRVSGHAQNLLYFNEVLFGCVSGHTQNLLYFGDVVKFCLVMFQDLNLLCPISLWSFVWSCFRTHSDSALHTSAMGQAQGNAANASEQYGHPSNTPPTHRRSKSCWLTDWLRLFAHECACVCVCVLVCVWGWHLASL